MKSSVILARLPSCVVGYNRHSDSLRAWRPQWSQCTQACHTLMRTWKQIPECFRQAKDAVLPEPRRGSDGAAVRAVADPARIGPNRPMRWAHRAPHRTGIGSAALAPTADRSRKAGATPDEGVRLERVMTGMGCCQPPVFQDRLSRTRPEAHPHEPCTPITRRGGHAVAIGSGLTAAWDHKHPPWPDWKRPVEAAPPGGSPPGSGNVLKADWAGTLGACGLCTPAQYSGPNRGFQISAFLIRGEKGARRWTSTQAMI